MFVEPGGLGGGGGGGFGGGWRREGVEAFEVSLQLIVRTV